MPMSASNLNLHTLSDATTDESGFASLRLPQSERIEAVVAWKDHAGLDYRLYSLSRAQQADVKAVPPEFPADGVEMLTLNGVTPLTVSVVDDERKLLDGVRAYPWLLKKDTEPDDINLSYFTPVFSQKTDATGKTTFNWIPAWQKSPITVWPMSTDFFHSRGDYYPETGSGLLEMRLVRLVPIHGRVVDADEQPVKGITVAARGQGYTSDSGSASTSTDDQGRYELLVPPDQIYLVVVKDEQWASAPQDGFAVFKNTPVDNRDFTLRKATRVFGTLVEEQSQEPIPNERVIVYQYGQDLHSLNGVELPNPENSRQYVRPMQFFDATTDDQGRFEFALGDGHFDIRPPRQEKADKFEIAGQAELELLVTTKVQQEVELIGLVFADEGNAPLEGVRVTGVPRNFLGRDWQATTGEDGKFRVKRYRVPTYVHAVSADKQLAAIEEVGPEKRIFVLQLQRVGSAKGRLLTSDSSGPLAGQKISYGVRVPDENDRTWSNRFGGVAVTEADGTFQLDRLVPGREYTLDLPTRSDGTIPTLKTITVSPEESIDLGDLPAPKP
ncbi:MAG: carboxypeptidase-like regulatory domain-containing protein [Planctomycetota bacterium]|nr:carboxypeptidase-like regulatory domain-containing protein [Planctomycetota bacterium]